MPLLLSISKVFTFPHSHLMACRTWNQQSDGFAVLPCLFQGSFGGNTAHPSCSKAGDPTDLGIMLGLTQPVQMPPPRSVQVAHMAGHCCFATGQILRGTIFKGLLLLTGFSFSSSDPCSLNVCCSLGKAAPALQKP